MKNYLLLIQDNAQGAISPEEWAAFFRAAEESGTFRGGSEIGERVLLGNQDESTSSNHIAGYMRFDSADR